MVVVAVKWMSSSGFGGNDSGVCDDGGGVCVRGACSDVMMAGEGSQAG